MKALIRTYPAALATYWLLQLGSRVFSWRHFFTFTEIMLLLLAFALLAAWPLWAPAFYAELAARRGPLARLRLGWFVLIAALRDWPLPNPDHSGSSTP